MKTLSNAARYGIRALIYLASSSQKVSYVNIREISDELDLSFHFLTRIFRLLTTNGILTSYRGPGGGVALAKSIDEIMLIEVVLAIEGDDYFDECVLGMPGCGTDKPCPIHDFWVSIKTNIKDHMATTSIAELADKVKKDQARLHD